MLVRFERFPMMRSPIERIFNFEQEIDDLFGNFFQTPFSRRVNEYPSIDIAEYENESIVVAEVPGVKKEDVEISVENGVLSIRGERKSPGHPENSVPIRNEIPTGEFHRAFQLPHDVKASDISAELSDGILKIVLPKAEEARPQVIPVK